MQATLAKEMADLSDKLSRKMDELLPIASGMPEDVLMDAMRYSCFTDGKRLRPFLLTQSAKLFGLSVNKAINAAVAVELIHTYSLVHDDLPPIDNDDTRRGLPSCHKKFGDAVAILAGDALLTQAFEILSDHSTHSDPGVRVEIINIVAKAAGAKGMLGGQIIDLNPANINMTQRDIIRMQRMKTSCLFTMCCEVGATLGRATPKMKQALKSYASNLGILFQLLDDLKDQDEDKQRAKDKGIDGSNSFLECVGLERTQDQAILLCSQAIECLSIFDARAEMLKLIAQHMLDEIRIYAP